MILTYKAQSKILSGFLRFAIAVAFLSAVFDRFGLWGAPNSTNVAWGDFAHFESYVAYLNPFLTPTLVSCVAWAVTLAEVVLAAMLIFGFFTKEAALASAALLLSFAVSMSFIMGIKVPLDYSVFTASAAAFLLYFHHLE